MEQGMTIRVYRKTISEFYRVNSEEDVYDAK